MVKFEDIKKEITDMVSKLEKGKPFFCLMFAPNYSIEEERGGVMEGDIMVLNYNLSPVEISSIIKCYIGEHPDILLAGISTMSTSENVVSSRQSIEDD